MGDFNEKIFTAYGFGLVLFVIGVIMFVFGAPRTAEGAWDWQALSTQGYVLNGPGLALIAFCLMGTIFILIGHRLEGKNVGLIIE